VFETRFQRTNLIQIEYFKIVDPNNKGQITVKWSMQYNVEFLISRFTNLMLKVIEFDYLRCKT
jgi:hypothetical protein